MMFQPVPGLYEDVFQIDFTSLYPAVIVLYNLSPETVTNPEKPGFLPAVLAPLLELRVQDKTAEENRPEVPRGRFPPQVDAGHLFRLYRV